jgi:hypothetical protein
VTLVQFPEESKNGRPGSIVREYKADMGELNKLNKVVCDPMALAIFSDAVMTRLVELKAVLEQAISDLR